VADDLNPNFSPEGFFSLALAVTKHLKLFSKNIQTPYWTENA
jgi:hypothetical protein